MVVVSTSDGSRIQTLDCDPDSRIQTLDPDSRIQTLDPNSQIQAPANPRNRAPRPHVSGSQLNSILSETKEQITKRVF